jgi:hypothetical protein
MIARMDLVTQLVTAICWYFRPLVKWFLRQTTRLCELQRVCYGETSGAPRTIAVEESLAASRSVEVKKLLTTMEKKVAVTTSLEETKAFLDSMCSQIMRIKQIKADLHRQFVQSMTICLRQIWGYKQLRIEVERLRSESFDDANLSHETQLLELWTLLQPDRPLLKRVTKQWQDIGFQGEDPKTDFRGMGILGLQNLIYFAKQFGTAAKHILSHSHHPKFGYSFAIVGINLTHMAYKLLQDSALKSHLYNVTEGRPSIENFHHFYSYLFIEFDKFWLECQPKDIMEFNRIRDLFENIVRTKLADHATFFKVNIEVDTV